MKRIVIAVCLGALLTLALTSWLPLAYSGEAKSLKSNQEVAGQGRSLQSEVRDLTIRLAGLNAHYQGGSKAERGSLIEELNSVAASRRELLANLIETDPAEVLRVAVPKGFGANLPAQVRANLEQHVDLEGRLEVLFACSETESRLSHFVNVAGQRLSLHFASAVPGDLLTDSQVRIKGVRVGDGIALEADIDSTTSGESTGLQTMSVSIAPNTLGEQRVLVLLVNFQDKMTQPWTTDQVRNVVFGSVNDFYKESSYQQTWLSGDVFGWYTLPINATCTDSTIATYAKQAATAAGVNLAAYNRYVYAFPAGPCGWTGMGSVGGNPSQAWANGSMTLRTIGHELEHGLGLYHSRALDCGSEVIGSTCSVVEYGDSLDILGQSGVTGHSNAPQKERLGWLNYGTSPGTTTVQASGTYWIDPYEAAGSNSKVLKALKSTNSATGVQTWYYVEFRRPIGFDSFISGNSNVMNGVMVHTSVDPYGRDNYLLDMTPGTTSWTDAALTVGRSYTDPGSNLTITPVSVSNSGASVMISFGAQPCVQANPSMTLSPSSNQWTSAGSAVTYQVSLTNNDSGCGSSNFNLQASVPVGWGAAFANPSVTVSPGATVTTILNVTSPSSAADGFYNIGVSAMNNEAPNYSASGSVSCSILSGVAVSVASNQASYTRSQTASMTAVVSAGGSPVSGATVSFTMTKSNGSKVTGAVTTGANGSAVFKYRFNKQKDPVGMYQVAASANMNGMMGTGATSFSVQ